jgi:hypothetical protein
MILRRAVPPTDREGKRLSTPVLLSIGVHVVVAVALMRMLILNGDFSPKSKHEQVSGERVGFVRIAKGGVEKPVPGKSGGDGKPATSREIHVVAPIAVPTTITAPIGPPKKIEEEGNGPLVGTGGPSRGVRPQYSDPRVWEPPGPVVSAPKTVKQTIDSLIADAIAPYNDSVAAAAEKRDPTDWTVNKGGYK